MLRGCGVSEKGFFRKSDKAIKLPVLTIYCPTLDPKRLF